MVETRVCFFAGDDPRAVAASRGGTNHVTSVAFRALAQAMLDDVPGARRTETERRRDHPSFTYAAYARDLPITHPRARKRFEEAVARLKGSDV